VYAGGGGLGAAEGRSDTTFQELKPRETEPHYQHRNGNVRTTVM
jgi:hypothetical protein